MWKVAKNGTNDKTIAVNNIVSCDVVGLSAEGKDEKGECPHLPSVRVRLGETEPASRLLYRKNGGLLLLQIVANGQKTWVVKEIWT